MTGRILFLILMLTTVAVRAQSAPDPTPAIPGDLQPWVGWVLHGHEADRCPLVHGSDRRQCAWPSRLQLDLHDTGGVFSQEWQVDVALWVPLPGDGQTWPQSVRCDGQDAIVVGRPDRPHVHLEPGRHVLTGEFTWDSLPQALTVPAATGRLGLSIGGEKKPFPEWDGDRLWLQRAATVQEQNHLDVNVHRRILDDIPLQVTTRIDLQVSGEPREEVLGRPLLAGLTAMAILSPLPARIEADGRLRLQVRPGTWTLDVVARHDGPADGLTLGDAGGVWDEQEIWVFEARNDLRLVTLEGAPAIDPQHTELPDDWRQLPAYAMRPGDRLQFVETQRGDADPAPDSLVMQRTWWLDFSGDGYTIRDEISGTMSRSWRLTMASPAVLGRATIAEQDQLITTSPSGAAGVEVRPRELRLTAESRIEGRTRTLDAVGWEHDVQTLGGELRVGPGWRVVHVGGVDTANPTWITTWTLYDLFVVMLVAMGFHRLFGRGWGSLALVTLVITYIEPGAPGGAWVAVLLVEALVRVLPAGRWAHGARLLRLATFVLLLFDTLPFMVQQARQALHPALEIAGLMRSAPEPYEVAQFAAGVSDSVGESDSIGEGETESDAPRSKKAAPSRLRYSYEPDPQATVQTGPGIPAWEWDTVWLRWSGPVQKEQQLRLYLVPPGINRWLDALRVVLLGALVVCIGRGLRPEGGGSSMGIQAVLAGLAWVLSAPAAHAEFPTADLLEQLRQRLLAAPACEPNCAASPDLLLECDPDFLRLRLRVDAAAAVAVPLPGRVGQWVAETILLDGVAAPALRRDDGLVWMRVEAGRHDIVLEGPVPPRSELQIHLPLRPHRVRTEGSGWTVDGIHADGVAGSDLVLRRDRSGSDAAPRELEPNDLPPFLQLTRELRLGLSWVVETSVVRMTPARAAVLVEVPLLPGEAVTTPDVRVVDGKVWLDLGAGEMERSWRSTLPQTGQIRLVAAESSLWAETWSVDTSPIWHLEASGIVSIHDAGAAGNRVRRWRPWPGESVELTLTRPAPVPGRTLTVDSAELSVSPGLRSTDFHLTLSLRSARAGEHSLTLPEGAELQGVAIGGTEQPIRQEGLDVTLPVSPGAQEVKLFWRQSAGVGTRLVSPAIDLGAPAVNATVRVEMPVDRWTLFTFGPPLGPTVLFWGLLVVFLFAALGLGRLRLTPLAWHQWFLLSLGLTQVPVLVALLVVAWLLLLGWRRDHAMGLSPRAFNGLQVLIVLATLAGLASLLFSIQRGLLGLPEMQIDGHGSSAHMLRWFQDISTDGMPQVTVLSVPLFVYRAAMLLWALWLARALLTWLPWGWESFAQGGLWQPRRPKPTQAAG